MSRKQKRLFSFPLSEPIVRKIARASECNDGVANSDVRNEICNWITSFEISSTVECKLQMFTRAKILPIAICVYRWRKGATTSRLFLLDFSRLEEVIKQRVAASVFQCCAPGAFFRAFSPRDYVHETGNFIPRAAHSVSYIDYYRGTRGSRRLSLLLLNRLNAMISLSAGMLTL